MFKSVYKYNITRCFIRAWNLASYTKGEKQTEGTTGEGADRKLLNYEEEGSKEVEKTA